MKALQIRLFRERLAQDKENLSIRRTLHEHYEWLESYWQNRYNGNNHIDQFDKEFGEFYWARKDTKSIARKFSSYPPVGSSRMDFEPTVSLQRATFYLRYFCDLFEEKFHDTSNENEIGEAWTKSPFVALLTIVKQVRDNLFHGCKMELDEPQYTRNKELIGMSVEVTTIVLDNLEKAEENNCAQQ
ncbi:hypothetical protein [Echinicola vietnamensis]|uniref:Apea-like HEPN domain-containing protein n=1 Tax=Echinicola vietnamensis (strain DSM 17526 / LMG 23754 / KMM 6221) TaxID=926556 RepID=L0G1N7_ECHVK|nr:hypothetical protein [Echinicola vietnamensis]AGA80114.1 hypothetical protein Echvi_3903 [Echinicola vietnamensis DSM 17526]